MGLDEYAQTGSRERVGVSAAMLQTIFTPGTPLHDGAVIIVGAEIRAAGAILPLTQYAVTDKTLGTRHRAAIGLSEETDALVIVVSEESAKISVALRGRLERDVDAGSPAGDSRWNPARALPGSCVAPHLRVIWPLTR